jgi:hypothetical protein
MAVTVGKFRNLMTVAPRYAKRMLLRMEITT